MKNRYKYTGGIYTSLYPFLGILLKNKNPSGKRGLAKKLVLAD
jgi:hypothetical protein